jgi:ERCC4-related helicase
MNKPEVEIRNNDIPNVYSNWMSLIDRMRKLRNIGDQSVDVIYKYLEECSEEASYGQVSSSQVSTNQVPSPNYKRIYQCIAQLVKGYSMKNAKLYVFKFNRIIKIKF